MAGRKAAPKPAAPKTTNRDVRRRVETKSDIASGPQQDGRGHGQTDREPHRMDAGNAGSTPRDA